jgi:hypothetical protein
MTAKVLLRMSEVKGAIALIDDKIHHMRETEAQKANV